MEDCRIPNQALNWNLLSSTNRKPGRPGKLTGRDLKDIPEAAGVDVWPNVSSTRDELRSQDIGMHRY